MKKIFAFSMAVFSMAAVMTSCQQDDTVDFIQQPNPNNTYNTNAGSKSDEQSAEDLTEQVVEIYLPVTDAQLEIMDIEITFSMPGRVTTIDPENMTEVVFPARIPDNDAAGTAKLLKYRMTRTYTKDELRGATIECTAKLNEEGAAKYLGQKINLFNSYTYTVTEVGKEAKVSVNNFKYSPNNDMTEAMDFEKVMKNYQDMGRKSPIRY